LPDSVMVDRMRPFFKPMISNSVSRTIVSVSFRWLILLIVVSEAGRQTRGWRNDAVVLRVDLAD